MHSFSLTGQPTFNNANSQNTTLILSNVDALAFFDSNDIEIVDGMASVSGELVCDANESIRDEIARGEPLLIGSEMNGTFVDGSAQCGDCGKFYKSYIHILSLNAISNFFFLK